VLVLVLLLLLLVLLVLLALLVLVLALVLVLLASVVVCCAQRVRVWGRARCQRALCARQQWAMVLCCVCARVCGALATWRWRAMLLWAVLVPSSGVA
jgi:hypothetical protein